MDVLYSGRDASYYLTMAQLLSGELMKTASTAAAFNIKDSFIKRRFEEEIRFFIHAQLDALKRSTSDNERRGYIENIRQEITYLEKQHSQLRMKTAKLHTSIIVTKRKDTWSYVIDGVGIVLGGLQVVAGIGVIYGSVMTGNIIGIAFGSMLILHGANSVHESGLNLIRGTDNSVGLVKEGYMKVAKFAGFQAKDGAIAYSVMDLASSAYGLSRFVLKPDAWRLFRFINSDYVRGFRQASKFDLSVEVYNDTMAIKAINEND